MFFECIKFKLNYIAEISYILLIINLQLNNVTESKLALNIKLLIFFVFLTFLIRLLHCCWVNRDGDGVRDEFRLPTVCVV